jgi:hypothetical protein
MLRLHHESSRSYPGRSAQRGYRVTTREPVGENAGWGYRLTKSRRYTGKAAPGVEIQTNGSQTGRQRCGHERAPQGVTPEVIGQKSAEAIVAKCLL